MPFLGWIEVVFMYEKCVKKFGDSFYAIFRIVFGVLFLVHGLQKFGFLGGPGVAGFAAYLSIPVWLAVLVGLIEVITGLLIALGLFTRTASGIAAPYMVIVYIIGHLPKGILPWNNGGELAVLYFAAFLAIHAKGAGIWCLEKALFKKERY